MYYSSVEDAKRVLRIFERWQFAKPPVVLESWLPDDDPNFINLDNEPEDAVKPYALLLNGRTYSIALALQSANTAANYVASPEAWLNRLLDSFDRPYGELAGPVSVLKARAVLKRALVESLV